MLKDTEFYKPKASAISNEFGAAPEREIMTLERIILQTFKFDLQVNRRNCWRVEMHSVFDWTKGFQNVRLLFFSGGESPRVSFQLRQSVVRPRANKARRIGSNVMDFRERQPCHNLVPAVGAGGHRHRHDPLGSEAEETHGENSSTYTRKAYFYYSLILPFSERRGAWIFKTSFFEWSLLRRVPRIQSKRGVLPCSSVVHENYSR